MNKIKLRDHQVEAIKYFEENNYIGLLEMATGTGKTITSLEAANRYYENKQRQFLVIIVPFLHLIDQWVEEFYNFNIHSFIRIAGNKSSWYLRLKNKIWDYNRKFTDRVVIIGSYKSICSKSCQKLLEEVDKNKTMLLADECHYIGSGSYSNNIFYNFDSRLGLSATPRRWWDEEGTNRILKLFGKIVYEYDLKKAIENGILTPYEYNPHLISLNEEELDEYILYSLRMSFIAANDPLSEEEELYMQHLAIRRASIIQKASEKIPKLINLLRKQKDKSHTLVYVAPGEVQEVIKQLSVLNLKIRRFDSTLSNKERIKVLDLFASGYIDVLVAIKCLDEGVDVPSTRVAYFVSSTSNPREFIQRRGRVLRKFSGKDKAIIHDFLVIQDDIDIYTLESIASKELPRFVEFSNGSKNKYSIPERKEIAEILSRYDLDMYLYMDPWDMYYKMLEEMEDYDDFTKGYS
ncbi:DEAD/DEAH box helicase family protein [uncultured Anaerococcus sp.]|uniref:DEAD/DEAH box helicase family protein n=1 Tax=uncultured Anaerococcus sp. TaxID=293428 RepID=UPI0026049545|nr:DEAD/DEAH box helicase family protein [uncultured Anaerococcus sp.]